MKDRTLEGGLRRLRRASRLREEMAVPQHQRSGAVSPRKRLHTILIKFRHFYPGLYFLFSTKCNCHRKGKRIPNVFLSQVLAQAVNKYFFLHHVFL